MNSLEHQFQFFADVPSVPTSESFRTSESVAISDDVLSYLWPTFNWLREGQGLNRYGVTVFHQSDAIELSAILVGWIALIKCAPPNFDLPSGYDTSNDTFVFIRVEKESLLSTLRKLYQWCLETGPNGGIVHWGI
ncbi:MAG: hypothetical protein R3E66_01130 [bacterium]